MIGLRAYSAIFLPAVALLAGLLLPAAAQKKTPPSPPLSVGSGSGENDDMELAVTIRADPGSVKGLIGSDLGGHYTVAEVTVRPKYGKEVNVAYDDFFLLSSEDGDNGKPSMPNQVAGIDAVTINRTLPSEESRSAPGSGNIGPFHFPGRKKAAGKDDTTAKKSDTKDSTTKKDATADDKPDPEAVDLEKLLASRILPAGKTVKPVTGLLYFALEKQKVKDLQLTYGGRENRIVLHFKADPAPKK